LDINQIWLKASSGKLCVPTFATDFSVPLRTVHIGDNVFFRMSVVQTLVYYQKLVTPVSAPCNGANKHFPSSKCSTPTSQFFMPKYKLLDKKYQIMQWNTKSTTYG